MKWCDGNDEMLGSLFSAAVAQILIKLPYCVVDGVLPGCKKAKVTSGHFNLFECYTADVYGECQLC